MKKLIIALIVLLTSDGISIAQTQLTGLTPFGNDGSSNPSGFFQLGRKVIFSAFTASEGKELWSIDESSLETHMIKDIYPGRKSGINSNSFVELNDKLIFIANDGESGVQLWSTDGTEDGTFRITKVQGLGTSKLTLVGNMIFFLSKNEDELNVWKSDGTEQGTEIVKEGLPIWNTPSFEGEANDLFFFTFQDFGTNDSRLWRSDGTESGTFPVSEHLDGNGAATGGTSGFTQYVELNNELYLVVRGGDFTPSYLSVGILKTDGSLANTTYVKGVHAGNTDLIDYADALRVGDKLYFSFFQVDSRRLFIWESDGTNIGTTNIYDQSALFDFIPSNLVSDGSSLFFTGINSNGVTGLLELDLSTLLVEEIQELTNDTPSTFFSNRDAIKLMKLSNGNLYIDVTGSNDRWLSDFTSENTQILEGVSGAKYMTVIDEKAYFSNFDEIAGSELWTSDVDFNSPDLLANINTAGNGMLFSHFQSLDKNLIFTGLDEDHGNELWVYNTSAQNVSLIKDIYAGDVSSTPREFIGVHDNLYFVAFTSELGREFWKTDGSPEGTVLVSDFTPGSGSSRIDNQIVHQGELYFSMYSDSRYHLSKIQNGSIELIQDLGVNEHGWARLMKNIIALEDKLLFVSELGTDELWISDGTSAGNVKIKDLYKVDHLTVVNQQLYFVATEDFTQDVQLWRSDGTSEGTQLVMDIGKDFSSFVSFNDKLFFVVETPETGKELWVSDGTEEGTMLIKDINPGTASSFSSTSYLEMDGSLYFSANDGVNGFELWKTDGTSNGTEMVIDINQGEIGSFPANFVSHDNFIFLSAYRQGDGNELWKLNTETNDLDLIDVITGVEGSSPTDLNILEGLLFFQGGTNASGRQLWVYSPEGSIPTGIDASKDQSVRIYPNPSSSYVGFEEKTLYRFKVYNLNGKIVKSTESPHERVFIGDLKPGLYFLVGKTENSNLRGKFIKK